jgi:Protein of unknown function (DUF3348)
MQHGFQNPGVAGSELTRLLARLSSEPMADARPVFAERLGNWLGWTGAIALASAMNAAKPAPDALTPARAVPPGREEADFQRVRAGLAAGIAAGPREPASSPTDFAPYRRHCHAQQQAMADGVRALRLRLREAVAACGEEGARLAAIDAVLGEALEAREHALLGLVPQRLQAHFEQGQRRQTAGDAPWLPTFLSDMQQLLQAELAHRLLPAQGLLATLHTHQTP